MTSRPNFVPAKNRTRNLNPIPLTSKTPTPMSLIEKIPEGPNRSAAVTKLQKEIKRLSEENKDLKTGLVEIRESVKQIFTESRHEKFDERRINMIKFHVLQLERQNSILTEALGSRSGALLEVENTMCMMADKFRSFISADVKGQMIPIARTDLITLVESAESARIKLLKSIEKNTTQELGKELLYLNPCMKNSRLQYEPVTLLDINLNRMEYINLRYVAQLESKLSLLYKELIRIHNQVETIQTKDGGCRLFDGHTTQNESERMKTSILKAGVMIKDCADDLLALSLLCPSAPWPILKRPILKDIPMDRVTEAMPPLPQQKREEVDHILKSCVGTLHYRINLLQKEKKVLEEELAFHRTVYDSQMKYTSSLFDAVREGCKEFEESARKLLCAPLKSLLEAYRHLQTCKSEDALRKILLVLKGNESQMTSIVEMFEDPEMANNMSRSEAISSFNEEFMQHVNSLVDSCQRKRDVAIMERREVRDSLKASEVELQKCIEDLEAKYNKQWISKYDSMELRSSPHQSVTDPEITDNTTARSSSAKSGRLKVSPGRNGSSGSKEFIHRQLFGDAANNGINIEEPKSSRNGVNPDEDKMDLLKLRSFLDEDSSMDAELEAGCNPGKTKSWRKKRWVKDFASSNLGVDEEESQDNENAKIKISNQKKSKKSWKPEQEWVNDFTSDSHLPDLMDNVTLSSRETIKIAFDKRLSAGHENMPHESEIQQSGKSKIRNKDGSNSRRSYEVDLRVARHKLKFKKTGGDDKNV